MDSITSILNNINTFSKSLFKFSQFFQPLLIPKHFPSDIAYLLNSDDFLFHLDQASFIISLKFFIKKFPVKKTKDIDKTISYYIYV